MDAPGALGFSHSGDGEAPGVSGEGCLRFAIEQFEHDALFYIVSVPLCRNIKTTLFRPHAAGATHHALLASMSKSPSR